MARQTKTETAPSQGTPDEIVLQKMKRAFKGIDLSLEDILAGKLDILDRKSDQADKSGDP